MTPVTAKKHAVALAEAIRAIGRLPEEDRPKALVAAWRRYGLPVQTGFHQVDGLKLHTTYGHMLRLFSQALSRSVKEPA